MRKSDEKKNNKSVLITAEEVSSHKLVYINVNRFDRFDSFQERETVHHNIELF